MTLRDKLKFWILLCNYVEKVVSGTSPLTLDDAVANSLFYVKAFGGTEQRNLPDGYIQRQFIYMMDGSYLLTDLVPTYDCKIEMDFQTTAVPSGVFGGILGGRTITYGGLQVLTNYSSGAFMIDAFGTGSADRYTSTVIAQNNTRYKFTFDNKVATLESGGSVLFTNTFTGTGSTGAALAINAVNDGTIGAISNNNMGIYLYSFKMWNAQGVLVADYVPAIQKGTVPVVGFYDTVSGTFKTATAGTFAAGGEAVPTPDAPMDIVSNNGVLKASINEFNANAITNGYFYNENLVWVANASVYTTDYMKTVKGKYTLVLGNVTTLSTTVNVRVNLFNANKEIQSQVVIPITPDTTEYTYEVDIPDGISYVRISTNPSYVVVSSFNNSKPVYADGVVETIGIRKSLASGYTELEYIESTGTQYIDTGITNENCNTYGVETAYKYTVSSNNSLCGNFEQANTGKASFGQIYYHSSNTTQVFSGIGNVGKCSSTAYVNEDYTDAFTIDAVNGTITRNFNGTQLSENGLDFSTRSSRTAFLFACNSNNGMYQPTKGQIKYFKMYKDGVLVRDFVPAKRNSDGVIGMYDTVSGQFFTNAGTGDFVAGGVVYHSTATAEMLLSLGDYTDEQEIISGVVTRKLGVKVLDGTEDWVRASDYVRLLLGDSLPQQVYTIICSHYPCVASDVSSSSQPANTAKIARANGGLYITETAFSTVDGWKQYLADQYAAGTPVIIVYPLATETTDTVTGQPMNTTAGDNILEITQASLDGLELEAKYKKSA